MALVALRSSVERPGLLFTPLSWPCPEAGFKVTRAGGPAVPSETPADGESGAPPATGEVGKSVQPGIRVTINAHAHLQIFRRSILVKFTATLSTHITIKNDKSQEQTQRFRAA